MIINANTVLDADASDPARVLLEFALLETITATDAIASSKMDHVKPYSAAERMQGPSAST